MQRSYPKQRDGLNVRLVNDEIVLLDLNGKLIHQLNQTATVIWNWCDGRSSAAQLANRLTESFNVDRETAEHDVTLILKQLEQQNLLESFANNTVN